MRLWVCSSVRLWSEADIEAQIEFERRHWQFRPVIGLRGRLHGGCLAPGIACDIPLKGLHVVDHQGAVSAMRVTATRKDWVVFSTFSHSLINMMPLSAVMPCAIWTLIA